MAIPHRYYASAPGFDNGSRSTDTHKNMTPITEKVRQVDVFGGFTAASGHNFYTARAFPKGYWNRVAFVCEPTGHIVHQNVMQPEGTDFEDQLSEGVPLNLLAGADEWVSPVHAEVGPDGAVWIADWYSFIIQHNPTPRGFENGSGNAYETDLRDYTHGRIYRVAYKNAPAYTPLRLSKERPQELVAALKNNNMFWRQTAQRLLVERGNTDVVPALIELVNDPTRDEIGNTPGALHALWTLHGLGALNTPGAARQAAVAALKHPVGAVRKVAVQVLPRDEASVAALLAANALTDTDPLVVLNALLAFSEMPLTPAAEKALLVRFENAKEVNDRWMPEAFSVVLNSHDGKLRKAYLAQLMSRGSAQSAAPAPHAAHDHAAMMASADNKPTVSAVPVTPTGTQPDLVITAIRMEPAQPALRETVRFYVEVQNRGGGEVPKGTVVPLHVRIQGADQLVNLTSLTFTNGLAAGATGTIEQGTNGPWTGPLSFNSDKPGTYTVTAVLDRENTIAEGNKTNNTFATKVVYAAPSDLTAFALERAVRTYTSTMPADSAVAMLRLAQRLGGDHQRAVMRGVADGWDPRRRATLGDADRTYLASLTPSFPEDRRERLGRVLQAWGVRTNEPTDPNTVVIRIKAVREAMQFDLKEFSVPAGKSVELVFENPDAMQHNVVIGKPKSMDAIGAAADKMITAKDGAEKNYVPAISQVLAATPLVNPDQSYRLKFKAPDQPGEYPYLCTFPGHWRIMNGVMKVVKDPGTPPRAR
jgi:azurin